MKLTLGFSPCPNDTFIFDAIVNKRIDLKKYEFDFFIADVEKLNTQACNNMLDISKLSFGVYAKVSENYQILNSGAALGFGNGPLLISKKKIYPDEIPFVKIAVPGYNTTAVALLHIFWQINKKNISEFLFSDIDDVVLSEQADAGLIIHETRFTYHKKGLQKIADLGEMWEKKTNLPLPLGAIFINRKFNEQVKLDIDKILNASVTFAKSNPEASADFIKLNAQEIETNVTSKHIGLYVNDFTVNIGEKGKQAINKFFELSKIKPQLPFFI